MTSQRLNFILTGRDELSRTLNGAGDSAARLQQRLDSSMRQNTASVQRFTRDARGRLRDLQGRFVSTAEAARLMGGGLPSLTARLGDVSGAGQEAAASLGKSGGGLGGSLAAVAAVAGLSLLPALGALVPMMAGAALAAGTMKLGFAGVGEALEAQSKGTEEYNKALKKLSPEARTFTKALVGVKKEFSGIGKDVQKAMLPGFTQAVKAAGPLVKILGRNMTDLGGTFGDLAKRAGRVFRDSGFQRDLQANLTLGKRFVGDMASGVGRLGRSFLSFGAASKPTLTALSSGIRDVLGRGLPGMFDGLKIGIEGSAKFFDGFFNMINSLLPALGRFSGEVARTFGPLLGEMFTSLGVRGAGAMDFLGQAVKAAAPVVKDLGFGLKATTQIMQILAPTLRDVGSALVGAFLPGFDQVDKARGPLQRLSDTIERNKGAIQEFARQGAQGFLTLVQAGVQHLPDLIGIFRLTTGSIVTALGGVLHAAASAFGWVPGIGDKLKTADREFGQFKDSYISGLQTAEEKARGFADSVGPKLEAGKLRLNINSWESQIKTAKDQLKSVPPSKRSALLAKIDDLQQKVNSAKGQLASIKDRKPTIKANDLASRTARSIQGQINAIKSKTVTITTVQKTIKTVQNAIGKLDFFADGGRPQAGWAVVGEEGPELVKFRGGETVFSNSDSRAMVNGAGQRVGSPAGIGRAAGQGLTSGLLGSLGAIGGAARSAAGHIVAAMKTELQIASPSKRTTALAKDVGAGLIKGLTGSKAKIAATSKDLAKDIWAAFSGSKDNRLVAYVNRQTKTLTGLAGKRDSLIATIKRAGEFAETTRVGAKASASLGGMFDSPEEVTASGIASTLQQRLSKMKAFSGYINTLAKRGLNKTMLREILTMGPEQGYAYASALAGSSDKLLKSINSTQYGINDQAEKLGKSGADALYDSGKNAGRGFLKGLASQQEAIEKQMLKIAKGMDKAIRKALGIKSPSRVMAEVGRYSTQGLALGLTQPMPVLDRALGRVAGRVAGTRPVIGRPAVTGGGGQSVQVQIDVQGSIDPVATAREIRRALLDLKRVYGLNINLGVG